MSNTIKVVHTPTAIKHINIMSNADINSESLKQIYDIFSTRTYLSTDKSE